MRPARLPCLPRRAPSPPTHRASPPRAPTACAPAEPAVPTPRPRSPRSDSGTDVQPPNRRVRRAACSPASPPPWSSTYPLQYDTLSYSHEVVGASSALALAETPRARPSGHECALRGVFEALVEKRRAYCLDVGHGAALLKNVRHPLCLDDPDHFIHDRRRLKRLKAEPADLGQQVGSSRLSPTGAADHREIPVVSPRLWVRRDVVRRCEKP